jgi:hypothetical protein
MRLMLRLMTTVGLSVLLSGCLGYVPGRQSHWDTRVKELCEKEAGVTVYERVTLTQSEYRLLRGPGGGVVIPSKNLAGPDAPYFRETLQTSLRAWNPEVFRREARIIRASDGKVLSQSITYGRIGGDMPSPAHPSSFGCRDIGFSLDIEQQTFLLPEGGK